jgi:hypothetical protein
VPEDNVILKDLHALLTAYDTYVTTPERQSSRAWIFQANPQFFDARRAVKQLRMCAGMRSNVPVQRAAESSANFVDLVGV